MNIRRNNPFSSAVLLCALSPALCSCSPAGRPVAREAHPTQVKMPFVRALLSDNLKEITIGARSSIAIECHRDGEQFVYYSPKSVIIKASGSRLTLLSSSGATVENSLERITVSTRNSDRRLWLDGKPYRGMLRALSGNNSLTMVNILYVEDYLRGVVPPELGPVTEIDAEAIKAQAIAARTYTISHLGQYSSAPYDLKSDVSDQLYQGGEVENKIVSDAIEKTEGEVARYDGGFIDAYYHSTCGGYTDNIENVWEKEALPYLVSVSCQDMCQPSKYYLWNETLTGAKLARRISNHETNLRGRKVTYTRIDSIYIAGTELRSQYPGLRTQELVVVANNTRLVYLRDRIRWVIGRSANPGLILRSDHFELANLRYESDGSVSEVTFSGQGYGHGLGMCQMGALGMARSEMGFSYRDILKRYYTGITIDKLY